MAPLALSNVQLVRPTKLKNETAALLNKWETGGFNPDDEDDVAAAKERRRLANPHVKEHEALKGHIFLEDPVRGIYEREELFANAMEKYCKEGLEDPKKRDRDHARKKMRCKCEGVSRSGRQWSFAPRYAPSATSLASCAAWGA